MPENVAPASSPASSRGVLPRISPRGENRTRSRGGFATMARQHRGLRERSPRPTAALRLRAPDRRIKPVRNISVCLAARMDRVPENIFCSRTIEALVMQRRVGERINGLFLESFFFVILQKRFFAEVNV